MTTDEAREAAWREWAGLDHAHAVARTAFTAGWDARGQHDKEQIAALVTYVQHRDDCYAAGRRALIAGRATECVCGLNEALRALAGQSEETTGE